MVKQVKERLRKDKQQGIRS